MNQVRDRRCDMGVRGGAMCGRVSVRAVSVSVLAAAGGSMAFGTTTRRTPLFASVLLVLIATLASVFVPAHAARGQGCGWLPGASVPGTNGLVRALAVLPGGDVIVGGDFTAAVGVLANYVARYNPSTSTWSALGSGTSGSVHALAVLPGGGGEHVIVGGWFTTAGGVAANNTARYSPTTNTWSALGSGTRGTVSALAVLPDGDVIMGGYFNFAGGVVASYIARYSPTTNTWSALGSGTNSFVRALAVLPGGGGGDVIVGGAFTTIGGVAASHIARFTPSTNSWSALGSGTNSMVSALAVLPGGDVIVGGIFNSAGGVLANRIARYSPTTNTWSVPRPGPIGSVSALAALPGGDVIAGENFTTGGGAVGRITRYNPTTNTWAVLGSVSGDVGDLAVLPDGDVIVGGFFNTAGGVAASNIARYNPSTGTWSALGLGTGAPVSALAVLPGGDVIVGGQFTTAGGLRANSIARYNPSTNTWSALGSGTNGIVVALAVLPGGDVIAGGIFTTSGAVAAKNIARYNPTTNTWSALAAGLNDFVLALAVLPGGDLIAGGSFTIAGDNVSAYFARYTFGSPGPSIATNPAPVSSCLNGNASLSVVASGTGPLTYQWQWQPAGPGTAWAALESGINLNSQGQPAFDVSGAGTATASIRSLSGATGSVGSFRCVVSNACGTVTSEPATLTIIVCACSPADITNTDGDLPGVPDGTVDNGDFQAFFAAFFLTESDPLRLAADIANTDGETVLTGGGPDGAIDNGDFNAFFAAFFGGCGV
ncbi:MAG: GC-type dockerin domain-anchored protein [Phycisphaerales bacterium]